MRSLLLTISLAVISAATVREEISAFHSWAEDFGQRLEGYKPQLISEKIGDSFYNGFVSRLENLIAQVVQCEKLLGPHDDMTNQNFLSLRCDYVLMGNEHHKPLVDLPKSMEKNLDSILEEVEIIKSKQDL